MWLLGFIRLQSISTLVHPMIQLLSPCSYTLSTKFNDETVQNDNEINKEKTWLGGEKKVQWTRTP